MPARTIIFYEKPGCATNARQKKQLRDAGHSVEARDILSTPWTRQTLETFMSGAPVRDWFNKAAPAIKSGAVQPEAQSPDAAFALMLADPLLIRRPLLRVGDETGLGFDNPLVRQLLSATLPLVAEGCSHPDTSTPPCPSPTLTVKGKIS